MSFKRASNVALCLSSEALSVVAGVGINLEGGGQMRKLGLGLASTLSNTTMTTTTTTIPLQVPKKEILLPDQLTWFQTSEAHKAVVSYIEVLNNSVIGVKLTDECSKSPVRTHIHMIE